MLFALVVEVVSGRIKFSMCEHARQVSKEGVPGHMMVRDSRDSRPWDECSAEQVRYSDYQSRVNDSVHHEKHGCSDVE